MGRFKLFLITLLILSVATQGYSTYIYARATQDEHGSLAGVSDVGVCYRAFPLDYVPKQYFTLTDPDQYILEAIEHPGNWTEPFGSGDSPFLKNIERPGVFNITMPVGQSYYMPFFYNGAYYAYSFVLTGEVISVRVLSEEPAGYWNLTSPDKYLLKAIGNPGEQVVVGVDDHDNYSSAPYQKPFRYNGKYYSLCGYHIDGFLNAPSGIAGLVQTGMPLAVVWLIVGVVYFARIKKK